MGECKLAKFTSKSIELKDGQKVIFGTADDAYLMWDDANQQMVVSTVISGVYPTQPGHLITMQYFEDTVGSGGGTSNHSYLSNLDYASAGHTGFASTASLNVVDAKIDTTSGTLQDGIANNTTSINYNTTLIDTTSGTLQTQITSNDYDIAALDTKIDITSGTLQAQITSNDNDISDLDTKINTTSGTLVDYVDMVSGTMNHSNLLNLEEDTHPQYVPRTGSRGFLSTVSGVDPLEGYDLTTRDYTLGIMDGTIPPPVVSGEEPKSAIQFHFNTSLGESSTNSTSWVNKMTLTVSGIPNGNYRIAWAFSWRHSKTNTDFYSRIQIDDTNEIFYYVASPYVDVNYWNPVSSFYYYDVLTSGTHYIDLDYSSSSTGSTSYIKEAKIEFWRIQ